MHNNTVIQKDSRLESSVHTNMQIYRFKHKPTVSSQWMVTKFPCGQRTTEQHESNKLVYTTTLNLFAPSSLFEWVQMLTSVYKWKTVWLSARGTTLLTLKTNSMTLCTIVFLLNLLFTPVRRGILILDVGNSSRMTIYLFIIVHGWE